MTQTQSAAAASSDLQAVDVTKKFTAFTAVADLSFSVASGVWIDF
jgi:hypothetical protein